MNARKTSRTAQASHAPHVTAHDPVQPHSTSSMTLGDVRSGVCKHRRLEPMSQDMIRQEITAYLDTLVQQIASGTSTTYTPASTYAGHVIRSVGDIEAALYETYRVLRDCWCFQGNPQDAFEAARALSPITLHLLLTYCRHSFTEDGQYVMLRGGQEQLPWVGGVMTILRDLLLARHHLINTPTSSLLCPATRLVLLNCRGFGWLDGTGNESYEASCRSLHRISSALDDLLYHTASSSTASSSARRVVHAGSLHHRRRRQQADASMPRTSAHSSTEQHSPGQTAVLLGNAIVMDGGVPALHLYRSAQHFLTHHEYGRGLACLVPRRPSTQPTTGLTTTMMMRPSGMQQQQDEAHVREVCSEDEEVGEAQEEAVPRRTSHSNLCAHDASVWANEEPDEAIVTSPSPSSSPSSTFSSLPQQPTLGSDSLTRSPSGASSGSQRATRPLLLLLQQDRPGAICCGTRVLAGVVVAQAILLSPRGPLVLHVEVGEAYSVSTRMPRASHAQATHSMSTTSCASTPARPVSDLASWAHALVSGDVMCDALAALEAETQHGVHGDPFTLSRLREWVEWVAALLQCPQPVVLVEWHVQQREEKSNITSSGVVQQQQQQQEAMATCQSSSPPLPVSFVLSLLQAYEAAVQATTRSEDAAVLQSAHSAYTGSSLLQPAPSSSHATSLRVSNSGDGWAMGERAVQAVLAMQPLPCAQAWDGARRPMLWARGLQARLESERELEPDMVLTSLQLSPSS